MTKVNEQTYDLGDMLKTLAEPMRFRIVRLLLERHHCARSLAMTLGISESAVSQHMTALRRAGLVTSFRHGYHVHYVLERTAFEYVVEQMGEWLVQMDRIPDCHRSNPCRFGLGDGSDGCLYRSREQDDENGRGPMRLAIPSETDQKLQSTRSGHFGHTPYFTIVNYDEDMNIAGVEAVKNVDHDEQGCGGVIEYVKGLGVDGILTIGMGMPPLMSFTQSGVTVYSETQTENVGDVARKFAEGKVSVMSPSAACHH
jgi:predicted Fe-Mo cluster-binding NifX family protein/DNA-binding transcriptional ArsR family regulator